jgi:tRNA-dihydrouridine synthase B
MGESDPGHVTTGEPCRPPRRSARPCEPPSLKCEWLEGRTGVLEMCKNYSSYFKGFRNASTLRHELMQPETKEAVLEVMLNFRPDAPDIQVPSAKLPEETADPDAVDTKTPDVPDELPAPGDDGATEEVETKTVGLPESMAA